MSQDHQRPFDQGAAVPKNDASTSDGPARPEQPALADPMVVLMQASQAAESLQSRFAGLQTRQAEINGERDQLAADRVAFENRAKQFADQVAQDRVEQRQVRSDLDEETRRVKRLTDSLEEGHANLQQAQDELNAERIHLQQAMVAELATDRQALQDEKQALSDERSAIAARQAKLEAAFELRQQQADQQLDADRETLRGRIREEFSSEVSQLNRERHEWSERYQLEQSQLSDEAEDLQQQRELLGQQISAEQSRLREELDKRRQSLLTEQTNLQRRYRFQFEYLARARNDFDTEVRQLRRDQQGFRAERQQFQEQHRLQLVKLSRIRELLEERESSLKRELGIIERSRTATQMDLKRQQKQLQEHRDSVNHDLEERTRQVILQEESIAQSTQRLSEKTQQLNRFRSELDSQQRDLLELRIIMEDVQGDLQKKHPESVLTNRQQKARESLQGFFDELHQRIHEERHELESQAAQLNSNRSAFRKDREQLEEWFEQNQSVLPQPMTAASFGPTPDIQSLKEELDRLRSEWAADQSQSEARIRSLQNELETLHRMDFFQKSVDEEPEDDTHRTAA